MTNSAAMSAIVELSPYIRFSGRLLTTFFGEQRSAVRDSLVVQHQYRNNRFRVAKILSKDSRQRIQVKVKPKVTSRFGTVRVAPDKHIHGGISTVCPAS